MKNDILAVKLESVVKKYVFKHEKPTLVESIFKIKNKKEKFTALNNISLSISRGEKVGIIGLNGAGKTTILKIIAGITTPTSGGVTTNGKVVSLINLSAGFHPELTGEENIYLSGLLIGMSKREIREKLEKIIRFSGIRKFIDAPLYTYSSGMKLRLGFSIAVHSDPDIFIIDEGISAGDEKFRIKASKKIRSFFAKNKTIIVVSHWLRFLDKNCERIIWMKRGRIFKDGGSEILDDYKNYFNK